VISLPARGGYGLPTAYFLLQAWEYIERSRLGTGSAYRDAWLVFHAVLAHQSFALLPWFVLREILPFMRHSRAMTDTLGAFESTWVGRRCPFYDPVRQPFHSAIPTGVETGLAAIDPSTGSCFGYRRIHRLPIIAFVAHVVLTRNCSEATGLLWDLPALSDLLDLPDSCGPLYFSHADWPNGTHLLWGTPC